MEEETQYAIYRVRSKDAGDSRFLDVPFLLFEEEESGGGCRRTLFALGASGIKLKRPVGRRPFDVVEKACKLHCASRQQLEKSRNRFIVLAHLRKAVRDPKTGKMELKILSPSPFTKQWGQSSQVLEPARSAFDAYQRRHLPAAQGQMEAGCKTSTSKKRGGSPQLAKQTESPLPSGQEGLEHETKERIETGKRQSAQICQATPEVEEGEAVRPKQGEKNKSADTLDVPAGRKKKKKQKPTQDPQETSCKERAWLAGVRHEQEEAAAQLAEVRQVLSHKIEAKKALKKKIKELVREAGGLEARFEALQAVVSAWAPPTT